MSVIVNELAFRRMLLLERRRCERTQSPFGLMLVDVESLSTVLPASAVERIGSAIGGAMRETDLTGWYQPGAVIGVILTTLNGIGRQALQGVMAERMKAVLAPHLDATQLQSVRVSCYVFPEDGIPNRIFYSDDETTGSQSDALIKRAIDIAGSFAALVLLAPLFILISVLIKMTSPGPIFFRQKRVGRFGKEFTFLKFRSMHVNSDPGIHKEYVVKLIEKNASASGGTYKIKNDPRVTTIGAFIRKSSLDELPQFINVLRGEMSLVGPRPPIPYEFERY